MKIKLTNIEKDNLAVAEIKSKGPNSRKAYNYIYDRYSTHIRFRMMSGAHDTTTVEELVSTVFIKAFERIETYNAECGAFSTWLYNISRYALIDHYRKNKADVVSIDEEIQHDDTRKDDTTHIQLKSSTPSVEEEIERAETSAYVHRLLNTCFAEKKMKEIVKMRYFDNMSYEEISEQLDMPLGTVKTKLFRAKEVMATSAKNCSVLCLR